MKITSNYLFPPEKLETCVELPIKSSEIKALFRVLGLVCCINDFSASVHIY